MPVSKGIYSFSIALIAAAALYMSFIRALSTSKLFTPVPQFRTFRTSAITYVPCTRKAGENADNPISSVRNAMQVSFGEL